MEKNEVSLIEETIKEVLFLFKEDSWIDFEIYYDCSLRIIGGENLHIGYDIEIILKDICFMSTPFEFTCDPSITPNFIRLLPKINHLNQKFNVIKGYYIFEFISEDNPDIECYIGAKNISYTLNQKGERFKALSRKKQKYLKKIKEKYSEKKSFLKVFVKPPEW